MKRENALFDKGKLSEYKEHGKCSLCEKFPLIREYPDGSGRIYCNCHLSRLDILKRGYYWGWNGKGKNTAIDKWYKENVKRS